MKTTQKIIMGAFLCSVLVPFSASAQSFPRQLKQGLSGDDIKILQTFLATDPTIYPEGLITGYYGNLTKEAVKRFQKKHNIEQAGVIGPKTIKKLNELFEGTSLEVRNISVATTSSNATIKMSVVCYKLPPGHLIAPGWLKKNNGIQQIIPECQILPPGIAQQLIGATTTPKTPDTKAPEISSLSYSAATSSASISWLTNEYATTKVYYTTISPVIIGSSTMIESAGLSHTHGISLKDLLPGTTYYFIAVSSDSSGNVSTSSQLSFVTTNVIVDNTAPVVSSVSSYVASTAAIVMWSTNESSTGKLYFSTSSPLIFASSTVMNTNSSALNQFLTLSPLTASTTYYYLIEAKDAYNNIGTSTLQSFTTKN